MDWLILAVGAIVALAASAALVTALERLGARFALPEATLGLMVALAADSPEVSSAVTAYVRGEANLGAGVVLGSNAFNLAALLGLGAVVASRIALHRRVVLFEGTVAVAIAALATQPVKAVVILSAKERIFIAGADLKWLSKLPDAAAATAVGREGQASFQLLANFKVPVVCAIHGACAGGGTESCAERGVSKKPAHPLRHSR